MNSVFYKVINAIVNFLKLSYDNSLLKKIIDKISTFFANLINTSLFMGILKGTKLDNALKNSFSYKIVSAPLNLLRKIPVSDKENEKTNIFTVIISFVKNICHYEIQDLGHILLALTIGGTITSMIKAQTKAWLFVIPALILALIPASLNNLCAKSKVVKFLLDTFTQDVKLEEHESYKLKSPIWCMAVAFVVGLISGLISMYIAPLVFFGVIVLVLSLCYLEFSVILTLIAMPFAPTSILIALCLISLVSFIIRIVKNKDFKLINSYLYFPVIMLTIFIVLSTITSVSFKDSLLEGLLQILFILFFIVTLNTLRNKKLWNLSIDLLVLGSLIVCAYGILQYFTLGKTASSWVDSSNFSYISTRVYSTFTNPNILGEYIILILPIVFSMLWLKKKEWNHFVTLIVNLIVILCLVLTWSRGAWIGALIALGFFVIRKDKFWLAIGILALFIVPTIIPAELINRLLSTGNLADSSTAYRVSVWTATLAIIKDHPLTGIGLSSNAFLQVFPKYAFDGAKYALHAHSFYLQCLVSMGIGGLIAFALIIIGTYKHVVSTNNSNNHIKTLVIAMGCGFLGILFSGIGENIWFNNKEMLLFWIYLALIASGDYISHNELEEAKND